MKTRPAASLAKGPAFLAGTEVTYGSQASRPGSHLGALHPYTCGGESALVIWPRAPYQARGGEVSASRDFRAPGTTTFVDLLQVSTGPTLSFVLSCTNDKSDTKPRMCRDNGIKNHTPAARRVRGLEEGME